MSDNLAPEWEKVALKFPRPADISDEEYIDRLTVTPVGRLLLAQGITPQPAISEAETNGRSVAIRPLSGHIESVDTGAPSLASAPVGAELTQSLFAFVRRFVVLTETQATVIAVWILHTHAFGAAQATPYLNISSAEKQSGKTRLLEILELLVARPWLTGEVTAAVLSRKIDAEQPTLLLDESDTAFSRDQEYSAAVRGILNTGYRASGKRSVCEPIGKGGFRALDLKTFCPKAFAGIGNRLPDTVKDRSIPIRMKRRIEGEVREDFVTRDVLPQAEPLREEMSRWVAGHADRLQIKRPEYPPRLSDRAKETWEPLLAIADVCGGSWPEKIRRAMVELCASSDAEDDSDRVQLLKDIGPIIASLASEDPPTDKIASNEVVRRLLEPEDSPWRECNKGKPITATGVAKMLKEYDIRPGLQRVGDQVFRGYRSEQFTEAFSRYVPPDANLAVTTVTTLTEQRFAADSTTVTDWTRNAPNNGAKPDEISDVTHVTPSTHVAQGGLP